MHHQASLKRLAELYGQKPEARPKEQIVELLQELREICSYGLRVNGKAEISRMLERIRHKCEWLTNHTLTLLEKEQPHGEIPIALQKSAYFHFSAEVCKFLAEQRTIFETFVHSQTPQSVYSDLVQVSKAYIVICDSLSLTLTERLRQVETWGQ